MNTVFVIAIAVLQIAPKHSVDEALQLGNFLGIGFEVFLHGGGEPGARSSLVAQSRNPHAGILGDLLTRPIVIANHGRGTMEGIVRLIEPLLVIEKASHIGNRFRLRLDRQIADTLHGAIGIGNDYASAPPLLAAKRICMQTRGVAAIIVDGDCGGWLADNGADG